MVHWANATECNGLRRMFFELNRLATNVIQWESPSTTFVFTWVVAGIPTSCDARTTSEDTSSRYNLMSRQSLREIC